jgi:hypothetical protein
VSISGHETGNLSHVVENVEKKEDCFKLCKEHHLCKWFMHIPTMSLCNFLVEPQGVFYIFNNLTKNLKTYRDLILVLKVDPPKVGKSQYGEKALKVFCSRTLDQICSLPSTAVFFYLGSAETRGSTTIYLGSAKFLKFRFC